jgi:hypothetical protein
MAELLNRDDHRSVAKEHLETLLCALLHTTLNIGTPAKDIVNDPQRRNGSQAQDLDEIYIHRFSWILMSLDSLFLWVLALRGTLVSRLSKTICHGTFFSPFTTIVNCLDICELYGHVEALVSHLGDVSIVSLFTLTTVIFLL